MYHFSSIFTIVSVLLLSQSCKKNVVNPTLPEADKPETEVELVLKYNKSSKPILLEFTSTGCPGCGSWGKPTFNQLIKEYDSTIIPLAIHIKYGDPMITKFSENIAANRYGSIYTPQIWVNDSNGLVLNNNSINGSQSVANIRNLINYQLTLTLPKIDVQKQLIQNKITVKYGVKTDNHISNNNYYLSCYLTQNGNSHNQISSPSNPTIHNYVIREAITSTWGNQINTQNGSISEFKGSFTVEPNAYNTYEIVVVLWEKTNDRYRAVASQKI
jgi:thiol-disulfide isomerase/thioredoxin